MDDDTNDLIGLGIAILAAAVLIGVLAVAAAPILWVLL